MTKARTHNKRYSKCGFLSCAQETASLSCVFVETFEIFTYISRFHRDRFPKYRDKMCWLTVEQQFNPALAIMSAVIANGYAVQKLRALATYFLAVKK